MNLKSFHFSRSIAILVALGGVILVAVGYMLMGQDEQGTVTASDGPATASEAAFVTLAGQLDSIAFDLSVLEDSRFRSLKDIHTAITPEDSGRMDPFAPAGR
ncbi:MAG TPA: hypothetical protein VHO23_02030 [Candidatus Paceibacterota bacterium]|nr:hypothetical protein [Candidatus Paceibacterota bacterium]